MALKWALVTLLICYLSLGYSFNLDVETPYIYNGEAESFFGYSLAFITSSRRLLVGAPLEKGKGTVRKCSKTSTECEPVDKFNSVKAQSSISRSDDTNQWMGASISSHGRYYMACAPHYKENRYKNNVFDSVDALGKCEILDIEDNGFHKIFNPCAIMERSTRLNEYKFCMAGLSSAINTNGTEKETKFIAGSPNFQIGSGSLFWTNPSVNGPYQTTQKPLNKNISAYLGYSMTTFKDANERLLFVGGAPRAKHLSGTVIIFDGQSEQQLDHIDIPEGATIGTYFGSSVATPDINNDKLADLVIGAPHYPGSSHGEGAVYVYLKNSEGDFELKVTLFGNKTTGSLFGYTVFNAGDLDNDGNEDFLVGAPYGGKDGKGAVFVYYGDRNAIPEECKQYLTPNIFKDKKAATMDGFGASFAAGADFDGNSVPDIAIGSFKSSQAMVVLSRPVVTIQAQIKLSITTIDSERKKNECLYNGVKYECVDVTIRFSAQNWPSTYRAPTIDTTVLNFEFALDVARAGLKRRGFIVEGGKEAEKVVKTNHKLMEQVKYKIYVDTTSADVFSPMMMQLNYKLGDLGVCNPKVCPTQSLEGRVQVSQILFEMGCGADGCTPDLVVSSDFVLKQSGVVQSSKIIMVGLTDIIELKVKVSNKGENSVSNHLKIVYPKEVDPNKVEIENFQGTVTWTPDATKDSDLKTLQVKLSSPLFQDKSENVIIVFGVGSVSKNTPNVKFLIEAVAINNKQPPRNKATETIEIRLVASLPVSGGVKPETVNWKKYANFTSSKGADIIHTFHFQNQGPSSVDESQAIISYPERLKNGGDYFLNMYRVRTTSTGKKVKVKCDEKNLNPLKIGGIETADDSHKLKHRVRRASPQAAAQVAIGEGSTILDCTTADCRTIVCNFEKMEKNAGVTVSLYSTLVDYTFDKVIKSDSEIIASAKFTSDAVGKVDKPPSDTATAVLTVNTPYLTKTVEEKVSDYWYWILVGALVALLIIGIVIFILYKKGFFKRKKMMPKTDVELEEEELEERERLKGDHPDESFGQGTWT